MKCVPSGVSPPVLLDDSMITLVGTPHPMTYIPMEDVFTFVDRRPNQELPAITEEIEVAFIHFLLPRVDYRQKLSVPNPYAR